MNSDHIKCQKEPLGIYIHIPFCVKKCDYCDFLSMPADISAKEQYINALGKEIQQKINSDLFEKYELKTIFIGGGTPTALPVKQLENLGGYIDYIIAVNSKCNGSKPRNEIEITIECNPGTIDEEKACILKKHGINRVSLGLQSSNNEELKMLGRIHTFEDFCDAYKIIRESGIENINVDLMSALPAQTAKSWEKTLRCVAEFSPEHISAYSLIIEEGTPFFEKFAGDEAVRDSGGKPHLLPSEEEEREMYELTESILSQYGYERYEISNYAKTDMECKHNVGYWKTREYLGVGLGAVSMMNEAAVFENTNSNNTRFDNTNSCKMRFNNTRDLKKYLSGDYYSYDCEKLTKEIQMEEFMFLGLRMTRGIEIHDFYEKFHVSIFEVYGEVIKDMIDKKLIEIHADKQILLTKKGIDVSNYVFEQFLF